MYRTSYLRSRPFFISSIFCDGRYIATHHRTPHRPTTPRRNRSPFSGAVIGELRQQYAWYRGSDQWAYLRRHQRASYGLNYGTKLLSVLTAQYAHFLTTPPNVIHIDAPQRTGGTTINVHALLRIPRDLSRWNYLKVWVGTGGRINL